MSRLQQHRQKQLTKRIIWLVIALVATMVIVASIGLNSIINATVFVNNFIRGNSNQPVEETSTADFYGTVNLDEPEVATNSAEIIVTGDASEFDSIEFYINNVKVEDASVNANGSFSKKIGRLRSGENSVYVLAITEDEKNKKKSDSYQVTYINEPPKLEIESPNDGEKTDKNEIEVKGTTDKNVTVRVNNSPTVVGFEGAFTSTVRLQEGENTITISATDVAGNSEEVELKVIYEKDE